MNGKQSSFRGETSGGVFKRSAVQYLGLQFLPRDYEHPRQFHMGVALGDRPQVWKEILILLEKGPYERSGQKTDKLPRQKDDDDYFIVIFGHSLNKLQFHWSRFTFL